MFGMLIHCVGCCNLDVSMCGGAIAGLYVDFIQVCLFGQPGAEGASGLVVRGGA